jgi:hypothetical protein
MKVKSPCPRFAYLMTFQAYDLQADQDNVTKMLR